MIRAARLDDKQLFSQSEEEAENARTHFMCKHQSRLLSSVSSLGTGQSDAPMLLLAAVCGSAFAEKTDELETASRYAASAIDGLGVFSYLLDTFREPRQPGVS